MPRSVEVRVGQKFQDGTGLTVRVGKIDTDDRVHFSIIEGRGVAGSGEMAYLAFVNRFTRIESAEDACVRIKQLGYVAFRRVRIYGEEFECYPTRFQSVIGSQFAQGRKETQAFAYFAFL